MAKAKQLSATNADLERQILETDLEQRQIALEQTKEQNAAYRQKREVAARGNAQRQLQIKTNNDNWRRIQRHVCQHMAGGDADGSPFEGGGKFAFCVISCTLMPDGITKLLMCPRCRMKLFGRKISAHDEMKLEKAAIGKAPDSQEFLAWDDYLWWKECLKLYEKEGLGKRSMMRGPTFNFNRIEDGAPVIPDITGYSTSGVGGR